MKRIVDQQQVIMKSSYSCEGLAGLNEDITSIHMIPLHCKRQRSLPHVCEPTQVAQASHQVIPSLPSSHSMAWAKPLQPASPSVTDPHHLQQDVPQVNGLKTTSTAGLLLSRATAGWHDCTYSGVQELTSHTTFTPACSAASMWQQVQQLTAAPAPSAQPCISSPAPQHENSRGQQETLSWSGESSAWRSHAAGWYKLQQQQCPESCLFDGDNPFQQSVGARYSQLGDVEHGPVATANSGEGKGGVDALGPSGGLGCFDDTGSGVSDADHDGASATSIEYAQVREDKSAIATFYDDIGTETGRGELQQFAPHQTQATDEFSMDNPEDVPAAVRLESADFNLSRDDVIARIETLTADLVAAAARRQLPSLSCISTARSNVHMAPRCSTAMHMESCNTQEDFPADHGHNNHQQGVAVASCAVAAATQGAAQPAVVRLGSKVQEKNLVANNGINATTIVRALQLLDTVHELLRAGRTATQRDIYYSLLGQPGFDRPSNVTMAIQTVLGMLRVPRAALGISAASKGAVAGCLLLRCGPGQPWFDCRTVGTSGRSIPGEVGAVDAMSFRSVGARCILVVEKDAVFQSLVESRLHEQLPCIIITGRGMPDVASRAFLAALVESSRSWTGATAAANLPRLPLQVSSQQHQQSTALPVLGLVDWNPGGVSILLAYKLGCAALGLESERYAVPSLAWLGVTSDMLQEAQVAESRCHSLTARDRALMPGLRARLAANPGWVSELEEMQLSGLKADIESLGHQELLKQLQRRLLQHTYLR